MQSFSCFTCLTVSFKVAEKSLSVAVTVFLFGFVLFCLFTAESSIVRPPDVG